MNRKLKLWFTFLLTFWLTESFAQEATLASGANASGNSGTVSYSVGLVAYSTQTDGAGTVMQGVQQAYEIFTITGIENVKINLAAIAYPNPTAENLTLTIHDIEISNLSFQVFDATGKLLQGNTIAGDQTAIEFGNCPSGIYFLKIMQGNVEIKSFKIIKN